jgi:hypothetical protein
MITDKEVADRVETWNWNLSIFEIYDEVRDEPDHVNEKLLTYAYHFFKEDAMIGELAYFLGVEIEKDGKLVGGKVISV